MQRRHWKATSSLNWPGERYLSHASLGNRRCSTEKMHDRDYLIFCFYLSKAPSTIVQHCVAWNPRRTLTYPMSIVSAVQTCCMHMCQWYDSLLSLQLPPLRLWLLTSIKVRRGSTKSNDAWSKFAVLVYIAGCMYVLYDTISDIVEKPLKGSCLNSLKLKTKVNDPTANRVWPQASWPHRYLVTHFVAEHCRNTDTERSQ